MGPAGHQARGFYSQMIVGDSFNSTGFADARWNLHTAPDAKFTAKTDDSQLFYGTPSERVTFTEGEGTVWLSNRGLGNAGLVFEVGKEYEGFMYAKGASYEPVILDVSLYNYVSGEELAAASLIIAAGDAGNSDNGFVRYNFSLIPKASTSCSDVQPASEPSISCGKAAPDKPSVGHTCVKCDGEFRISLAGPPPQGQSADVLINYIYLSPGPWGRLSATLPVLASAAATLKEMGVTAIRQGGSFASVGAGSASYYQWQKWAGPAWTRPSRTAGVWRSCLLSGWGNPFSSCNSAGDFRICALS